MSKKKILYVVLCCVLILGIIVGIVLINKYSSGNNDKESLKKVEEAFENLKNLDETYEISNVMQAPDGNLCYVEICDSGFSYTEYPVDADGNYGTIAFQDSNNTEYVLSDWVTSDGKGFVLASDNEWVSYPSDYSKKLKSRNLMYFDIIIEDMTDLEFDETITADIGMGDEDIDIYTAKVSSDTVHSILGLGSEELYKNIKSETKDKNIEKLCDYYLEDIGFTMVFSDANLTIGVIDGVLRYVQLEIGGLGTRLYLTKAILTQDVDVRQEPDFSNVDKYEDTMKEMADYIAEFDSYEEAMQSLGSSLPEFETDEDSSETESEESETEESGEDTTEILTEESK